MKIGIAGAMLAEIELLCKDMVLESSDSIGGRIYHTGKLYGWDVTAVYTKCGKVASAAAITTLIERYKTDMIIFTGVAGAAASDLNIGDVVIADELIQHDFDLGALTVSEELDESLTARSLFKLDNTLTALMTDAANKYIKTEMPNEISDDLLSEFEMSPKVVRGTMASGDRFISDKAVVKSLLSRIDGLKCVDMESAVAAQLAFDYSVPILVCRVMSDKADDHANINFYKFIENAATQLIRGIIRSLLAEMNTIDTIPNANVYRA